MAVVYLIGAQGTSPPFPTRGQSIVLFIIVNKLRISWEDKQYYGLTPSERLYPCFMKTIAVLGASADRAKFGNKAVRAYLQRGFTVFPVNTKESEIEGLTVFRSLSELPVRPDVVSVYLQPRILERCLPEIAEKGCDELWLNPGTESDAVLTESSRLKLNVVLGCSIIRVGVSPSTL